MSPESIRIACAEAMGLGNRWVLMKRGFYYRPNAHGYTSALSEAWIVDEETANRHTYPHDEPVTKHPAPLPDIMDANHTVTLIEHLAKEGWLCQTNHRQGEVECVFHRMGDGSVNNFASIHESEEHGHSAPTFQEAVAGAFLKTLNKFTND